MNKGLKGLVNAVSYAFFVILKSTHCSEIFAELHDRLADYCTDQRAMCEHTGSYIHIVCEYYGKSGSSCSSFKEVRLGESNVEEILRRINTMRIHVAKGEGQDGQMLPRAYGMRKIFWDSELAAFAQIMVAQCLTKHRYSCATTKTFSNPMMVYTFANTTSSAAAIIDNIFSNWEAAPLITQDDIFQSPDLKEKEFQVYIKLVVGNASHIGCAIGVYEHEIKPYAIEAYDNLQLSGHLVCYMSHYSETGTPVYNTTAPVKGTGWTRCGCPPGLRETKDCLCVASKNLSSLTTSTKVYYDNYEKYMNEMRQILEATKNEQEEQVVSEIQQQDRTTEQTELESTPKLTQANPKQETGVGTPTPTCNDQGKCEPKIVMLPIFTIQNGPKNVNRRRGPGQYRRSSSDGTSFVQSDKATDELSVSEEKYEVLPKNISLRSKLLESVRAIRNQEGVPFFSDEQNGPNNKIMEQSQHIMEPFEQMLETTTQQSDDRDSNEKTKKKVNRLLDLLEEKGKKTQLSSKEIIEFDAKMRRIYKNVLGTVENFKF